MRAFFVRAKIKFQKMFTHIYQCVSVILYILMIRDHNVFYCIAQKLNNGRGKTFWQILVNCTLILFTKCFYPTEFFAFLLDYQIKKVLP